MELKKNSKLNNKKSNIDDNTMMLIWIVVSIIACILGYVFLPYIEMSFIYNEF